VPLPSDLSPETARKTLDAALKRFGKGFLKTIGLYAPQEPKSDNMYLQRYLQTQARHFGALSQKLTQNYAVEDLDLKNGVVPENIDILLLAAPEGLKEKQLYAIDQFLMRGGTVIMATSPFVVDPPNNMNPGAGFTVRERESGLEEWLASYGISISKNFVLDPQCDHFVVTMQNPRTKTLDLALKEYPYFVSVRGKGLNESSPILSGLSQLAMGWSSPIVIDSKKNSKRKTTHILTSSANAWMSDDKNVTPNYSLEANFGIIPQGLHNNMLLGAVVEGAFNSYFKGKESPLVQKEEKKNDGDKKEEQAQQVFGGQIDRSAESAKIIIYSSNEFLSDETLQIFASVNGNAYLNSLQLIENTVDWALEDPILLSIRARERYARTLWPMTDKEKAWWEYAFCYGGSLLGLLLVFSLYRLRRASRAVKWRQYESKRKGKSLAK